MTDRRIRLSTLAKLAAGAAALGAAVFASGVIPIDAAGGHTAVGRWVLHTAMRRSVIFHAWGTEVPDLSAPGLARLGAAHFESGCAPCHGSPAAPAGGAAREMLPPPPDLAGKVDHWTPAQLHWIVDKGVMMTGMPAWPARGRGDEVWAMVAFLQRLPDLDAQAYRALAFGEDGTRDGGPSRALTLPADPPAADCVRCHGPGGRGPEGEATAPGPIPRLDIQPRAALEAALESYAAEARPSGIMRHAAAALDAPTLAALAARFAEAPRDPAPALDPGAVAQADLARGGRIAREGLPERDVAACDACHAPPGERARDVIPRLAGQRADYLAAQLRLYLAEPPVAGGRYAELMVQAAHRLPAEDVAPVAAWYASRRPAPR